MTDINSAALAFRALPPRQQRVIEELAELRGRLTKLGAFIEGSVFPTLPEAEQSRLLNQARFMGGYAAVLEERIAHFGTGAPASWQDQCSACEYHKFALDDAWCYMFREPPTAACAQLKRSTTGA